MEAVDEWGGTKTKKTKTEKTRYPSREAESEKTEREKCGCQNTSEDWWCWRARIGDKFSVFCLPPACFFVPACLIARFLKLDTTPLGRKNERENGALFPTSAVKFVFLTKSKHPFLWRFVRRLGCTGAGQKKQRSWPPWVLCPTGFRAYPVLRAGGLRWGAAFFLSSSRFYSIFAFFFFGALLSWWIAAIVLLIFLAHPTVFFAATPPSASPAIVLP